LNYWTSKKVRGRIGTALIRSGTQFLAAKFPIKWAESFFLQGNHNLVSLNGNQINLFGIWIDHFIECSILGYKHEDL